MSRILEIIGVILGCLAVLSIEQAYGVPFVAFFLVLELSFRYSFWERFSIWLILGLGVAGMFNLPLSLGVGCLWLLTGTYVFSEPGLKGTHLRAILISLVGSLVIANLAEVPINRTTLMTLGLSLVSVLVLVRQFFWSRALKFI